MQVVNRSIIILKPKEPYLSWANHVAQSMESLGEIRAQSKAILIPQTSYSDQARAYLEQNYARLFEIELEGWASDKKRWPPKRDFDTFLDWFDVEVYALVLDDGNALLSEPYN